MESKFFSHLKDEFREIYYPATKSEEYVLRDPEASAIFSRKALELFIKWAFDNDDNLINPIKDKIYLIDYIKEHSLSKVFGSTFYIRANKINRTGNKAVHDHFDPVSKDDSILSLNYLVYISGLFYSKYGSKKLLSIDQLPKFDERLLIAEEKNKFSENDLRLARKEKEQEILKIKNEYKEEFDRLKLQYENDIQDIERNKEDDIERIKNENNYKINSIISENKIAVESINKEKLKLKEKLDSEKENSSKIVKLIEKKDKELQSLNLENEQIIEDLNNKKDNQIISIQRENEKKIIELKSKNEEYFTHLFNEVSSNKDLINQLKEKIINLESSFIKISDQNKKPKNKNKIIENKEVNSNKKKIIDETQGFGSTLPKMFSKIDFKLQEAAANVGGKKAQYLLAELYEHGRGCAQNYKEAYKWFSIAAQNGSEDAVSSKYRIKPYLNNDEIEEINEIVKIFLKKKN